MFGEDAESDDHSEHGWRIAPAKAIALGADGQTVVYRACSAPNMWDDMISVPSGPKGDPTDVARTRRLREYDRALSAGEGGSLM